jgi:inosine-uridine nucleoside N-ribohydrolase
MLRRFWITLLLSTAAFPQGDRIKVLLDTDPGTDIDDAWALAFVALHPRFETVGVTVTDANTPERGKLACKLLQRARRTDIPVAVGRQTPTPKNRVDFQFFWSEDFDEYKPIAKSAADFIVETARKSPGEITLLAVGPLQNVADALRKDPGIAKLFKRVVLMSGNVYHRAGNQPVIPEWNVVASTEDAQVVYSAGLPLTIVPLDSTTLVRLADEERERIARHRSPVAIALEALYRLWLRGRESRMTLHDQLAVAETVEPGRFFGKCDSTPLIVDDKGFTRIDAARGKPVSVCLEPKRDEFMRYYIDTLLR